MSPQDVIQQIKDSGLRGRGGAGFPAGLKWQFTADAPGKPKYVVCNADEGDPGAFMDRSILEGDPHSVIEAMTIAGFAVGAEKGFVYVRAEYPLAVQRLTKALEQARQRGYLGKRSSALIFPLTLKSGGSRGVRLRRGNALIASIEGSGRAQAKASFPCSQRPVGLPNLD